MCVFSGRVEHVSDTDVAVVLNPKRAERMLWYRNTVRGSLTGPNCMIIHLRTAAELTGESFVSAKDDYPSLLDDWARGAIEPDWRASMLRSRPGSGGGEAGVVNRTDYSVVWSTCAAAVDEALIRVPGPRRPTISREILDFYAGIPNTTLTLWCWEGQTMRSTPMGVIYRPDGEDKEEIFWPALDAHDGKRPVLTRKRQLDHRLLVGIVGEDTSAYTRGRLGFRGWKRFQGLNSRVGPDSPLAPWIPTLIQGVKMQGSLTNGDLLLDSSDLADLAWNIDLGQEGIKGDDLGWGRIQLGVPGL